MLQRSRRRLAKDIAHLSRAGHRVTLLENGLRILSVDDHSPMSGFGLFSKIGSRYETSETMGAATLMEGMILKGNAMHPQPGFATSLAALGASIRMANLREAMGWMVNVPRYELQQGLDLLHGCALHPTQDPAVFQDAIQSTGERLQLVNRDVTRCCFELVHQAAYDGVALGRPMVPTLKELNELTMDKVSAFHAAFVQPKDSVVVGVGIENHDDFVERVVKTLKWPTMTEAATKVRAQVEEDKGYIGGMQTMHNTEAPDTVKKFEEKNLTHIGLCFRGVPISHPDYYVYSVIQTLLGGGTSFSSGGPGKGMHTKLFREVINRMGWIHGIEAVTAWYSHSGLVGLYGQCEHQYNTNLCDVMAQQAASIAARINERHLEMASNQLLSQLVLLGEGRDLKVEEYGKNLLLHNHVQVTEDLIQGSSKVTLADLKRVCGELVDGPATYAVYGNTEKLPDLATLEKRVRAYKNQLNK